MLSSGLMHAIHQWGTVQADTEYCEDAYFREAPLAIGAKLQR
jgi:hypothetical protein